MLHDLKEARERLNQNSRNSARPPSSEAPWEKDLTPNDSINESEEQDAKWSDRKEPKPLKDAGQAAQQTERNEADDLISVIETCRKRQQSLWIYLAIVSRSRRSGLPVPKLPIAKGSK